MKAEAFVALRPACRAIATAGVSVSHRQIIEATRGEEVAVAFDSAHRQNAQVCRQLGKLIAEREQDTLLTGHKLSTSVVVWDGVKGIDDAVLTNKRLHVIGIAEWFSLLEGASLVEVQNIWTELGFAPKMD